MDKKILSCFQKVRNLINENDLSIKTIYDYTFEHKNGIAFEYFDYNGKFKKMSYRTFDKLIKKFASIISKQLKDVEKHNVVILKLSNSPEWCISYYAILMAGFKPLFVNASTKKEGVINLANQTHAVAIVTDDPFRYEFKKIYVDMMYYKKAEKDFVPDWEDEVIFCSSGTTGDVKLMVFNGKNLCHQIAACLDMPYETDTIMYPRSYGKIKLLAMIPFHHIFGFVALFLWYSPYRETFVFPSSMNSSEIQSLCVNRKVSHVYSVPLFFDSIALQFKRTYEMSEEPIKGYLKALLDMNLENGKPLNKIVVRTIQKKLLGPSIRMCISGGGYLSDETMRIVNGIGYPLYNGFGMTEIGVTSVELTKDVSTRLKCSVGKALHGVSYKIAGDEKQGELLVKSQSIHSKEIIGGVVKDSVFDEEGYFHTGDIAEIEEDGRVYIKGRAKDVIINANGENIFPDELELYFRDIKDLGAYTVLGIKKDKKEHREAVSLVTVVKAFDKEITDPLVSEIRKAAEKLPNGVVLDDIYFTKKALPVATNRKVKRLAVKKAIETGSEDYVNSNNLKAVKEEVNFDDDTIMNILVPVKKLFAQVLFLKEIDIKNDSHWINDLGGDSMNFFELVNLVNEEFGVTIPDEKFIYLTSVNEFVKLIVELKQDK
ncbi:MAG: AMP-binding protein [Firmicutes bacterium]|nr:AMP-binding protein [Candidatus Fiminaster equi]